MNPDCSKATDAMAFVTGDLSPEGARAFAVHLATCPCCRQAEGAARSLHARLLAAPVRHPSPRAAGHILAAILAESTGQSSAPTAPVVPGWLRPLRLAAAAAAITLGLVALPKSDVSRSTATTPGPAAGDPNLARALAWMLHSQEADGSWDASRWGGSPQFQVALTALPAMALLKCGHAGPTGTGAADRAVAWLLARQSPDGLFGEANQGMPYNHTLATFALLHAYARQPAPGLHAALDRALAAIHFRQLRDGSWGYAQSRRGDHSITEWTTETLAFAQSLGWQDLAPRLVRSRAWLARHPRSSDDDDPIHSPGTRLAVPPALATGPDMDAAYFQAIAWQRGQVPPDHPQKADLRQQLLAHQIIDGSHSGSWPATDRWARAGGRLYATALATLALTESR